MHNMYEQPGRRPLLISLQQRRVIALEILACTTSECHENRTHVSCVMFEAATSHSIGSRKESNMLCKKWRAARSVPTLPSLLSYCQDFGSSHSTQAATTHEAASTATSCEKIDL